MKYKKFIFVFVAGVISLLSGCGQESVEIDDYKFIKYDIESIMPRVEYKICSVTKDVTMYFPVVTSKAITETELGGVAARLPLSKDNIKVTLHSSSQDKINYQYFNKYISFLKYQVEMENKELLQANDTVTLCDTMLWIYHNSEFQKIQIDEDYLQITIVDNEDDKVLPDWNRIIANLRVNIESQLKNVADQVSFIAL